MRIVGGITATLGLAGAVSANLHSRSQETRDFFALHLDDTISPSHIAQVLGARHEGQIGQLDGHHTFSFPREESVQFDTLLDDLRIKRKLRRRSDDGVVSRATSDDPLDKILWSHKLAPPKQRLFKRLPPVSVPYESLDKRKEDAQVVAFQKKTMSSLGISDPIFKDQWHILNTIQPGHDLNVTGVWLEGITGEGIATAVVDDGLDMNSNDLKPNYFSEGSWDFNGGGPDPLPVLLEDKHGTRCCGEIAAAKNDVCGVGVAYGSKIAGIRMLSEPINDADEAQAITYAYQKNDIYSCSWGPIDDGATMEGPGILIKRAMADAIQKGRGGKGSVYVFAAGNGAAFGDNCNFDGYTNSIYSITVGAIDREGQHPNYSESCSAQLVVAYSSGAGDYIHTTDVGASKCYTGHGGTSAAGPLAAGSVALALSVRPELTWRDMQYIMLETAVPVSEDDGSWQTLPSGRKFSHDWGFGKVDTYSLVQLAKTWDLVKPQAWLHSPWLRVHQEIPQGDQGLLSRYTVTADQMKKANLAQLEHVTVTMNINHTRRGDLSVELRSPAGIVSYLSVSRSGDNMAVGYVDWTFMSVAHWGESPVGEWSIVVKDAEVNEHSGTFIDWRLNLWAEAADGAKQKLHPLPDEHDDDHPYEDAHVATTSVTSVPSKTGAPANPDDHHDRPVNVKPQPTATEAVKPTESTEPTKPTESTTPIEPVEDEKEPASTTGSEAPSPSSSGSGYISSYLPTFGASKRTQIWIYASLSLIIVFFIGLGVYFQLQRVKRRRTTAHDDYEFEMIEDEDEMQPMAGTSGRTQRRGGELYNAFAGESDEEMFSDDDEPYRDGLTNVPEKHSADGSSHGGSHEKS